MAIYADYSIDQGQSFYAELAITDSARTQVTLENTSVYGQIRKYYTSNTAVDFICAVIDAENGIVSIELEPSVTRSMKPGRYVFDVFTVDENNFTTRIVEGQIEIFPAVTRLP